jgi:predicted DNA-binding transcriptional regulator AlpA
MTTLLSSNNAANFLGYSDNTLRNSRYTGTLASVSAPPHIKLGKSVRYSIEDLNDWLTQFNRASNTDMAKGA